jgi:hypothetical protein
MNTKVVNLRDDQYDIYIGRVGESLHYGNPFSHIDSSLARVKVSSREEAVKRFSSWLKGISDKEIEQERRMWILNNLVQLKGRVLGCFCKPKLCHGDIYAEAIDNPEEFFDWEPIKPDALF